MRVTQLAEQLVEVPTPVSCMEQFVDIPVPGRGGSGCLLGFRPGQGTTAPRVSPERISERIVEQIGAGGDFPSRRAGPHVVLEVLTVFSQDRFQRRLLDLITWMCTCLTPLTEFSFVMTRRQSPISGTDALARRCGSHRRASESSGSARRVLEEGPGSGTRVPVSAYLISLRCLLSEAHRNDWLGINSPLLGCHLWQTCSVSACCLRRALWLLGLVASVSCVLLARQWIQYIRQSSVAIGCYFTHSSMKVGLGS